MTEREALLAAIRESPDNDLPRLIYADYLDEHGSRGRDAATVEFIRISCKYMNAQVKIMPREAYPWIEANWRRLVPAVLAAHKQPNRGMVWMKVFPFDLVGGTPDPPKVVRTGRLVRTQINTSGCDFSHANSIVFEFWKGFVSRVELYSQLLKQRIRKRLQHDQPLAKIVNPMDDHTAVVPGCHCTFCHAAVRPAIPA